jgi:hypothetical protein
MPMKGKYLKGRKITYDGTQLRSLWALNEQGVQGDSVVAFRGPCDVSGDALVDQLDAKAGKVIRSDDMVHFIVELFDSDLPRTVVLRRLLVFIIKEVIEELKPEIFVERKGNDLFIEVDEPGIEYRKLSVSIATVSPVSTLIHVGVNVTSDNTPVPTFGLTDLEVPVEEFVLKVLQKFITEIKEMDLERTKVRGVP